MNRKRPDASSVPGLEAQFTTHCAAVLAAVAHPVNTGWHRAMPP